MFHRWLRQIHLPLTAAFCLLCAIGILSIYSAARFESGSFAYRQLIWVGAGFLFYLLVSRLSYRVFVGSSYLLYVFSILLLLWVLFLGQTRLGAQRWIHLGPFLLQPSEPAKLATILALANFLGSKEKWEQNGKVILAAIGMTLLPLVLIMKQPDLGSSLIFIPILAFLLFVWGIRWRYLIGSFLAGAVIIPFLWLGLKEYQKKRILVFLDPGMDPLGAGYTAMQSKIAVGSGGFWGKGFLQGTQGQLDFVPEHHTDFIFCVIGEEWGFLGALFILACYAFLFQAILQIMHATTDMKARLIGAGVLAVLFSQVFINIGMSFGLMPITGITLPLISYGGSSLITTCMALGLVLSIHRERSIF